MSISCTIYRKVLDESGQIAHSQLENSKLQALLSISLEGHQNNNTMKPRYCDQELDCGTVFCIFVKIECGNVIRSR